MAKGFGGKLVWKPLLVVVGFILVTLFLQAMVNAVAYLTLPTISYPFQLIGGVSGEGENAYNTIADQTWLVSEIARFTQIAVHIWIIALCSIAVHILAAFSWTKSILVGAVAYVVTILAEGFLLG
jgi:energy-coupling factor transporter transmembrane protein EcfT